MLRRFSDEPNRASRALQVWLILIGKAHNRQTMTYGMLAEDLGFKGAGVLADILGHIMYYCREHELPPLTVLVVNRDTGLPGHGLTEADLNADRERVFNHRWYDLLPPSPDELSAAFRRGKASAAASE